MCLTDNNVVFRIDKLVKQSAPNRHHTEVTFPRMLENHKLCVVRTLECYLNRTKAYRIHSRLFLSLVKPYQAVCKSTIAKWIKHVIALAGIDISKFGAHSTRAASVSKAKAKNVPLETILKAGGWTNAGTFGKFYNKCVQSDNHDFARTLLTTSTSRSSDV